MKICNHTTVSWRGGVLFYGINYLLLVRRICCLLGLSAFGFCEIGAATSQDLYVRVKNPTGSSVQCWVRKIHAGTEGGESGFATDTGGHGIGAGTDATLYMGTGFCDDGDEVFVIWKNAGARAESLHRYTVLGVINPAGGPGEYTFGQEGTPTQTNVGCSCTQGVWYYIGGAGGTPPTYCIDLATANTSAVRQKYKVLVGGVVVDTSLWIEPGQTFSYQYCTDVTPRPSITIQRITDGDPPTVEYSRVVDGSDSAWHASGGSGTNSDSDAYDPTAGAPGIPWVVGTTAASDENIKKGFEAIYGISKYDADSSRILLNQSNSKLGSIQTSQGLLISGQSAQTSAIGSGNTKLDTVNSQLATIAANTTASGGSATAAKQDAHKAEAHTDAQNVGTAVGNLQTANTSGLAALNTSVQNVGSNVATGTSGAAANASQAHGDSQNLGSKLDTIGSNTAGMSGIGSKLDDIKASTDQARVQAKTSGEVQGIYDTQYNSGVAASDSVASFGNGMMDDIVGNRTPIDISGGPGNSWQVHVGPSGAGANIDLNPFNNSALDRVATWVRGIVLWASYLGLLAFIIKVTSKSIFQMGAFQQAKGMNFSVAGFGTTLPAALVVAVIIGAALTAIGGFFVSFMGSHLDIVAMVKSNPLTSAYVELQNAVWLMNKVFPLAEVVGLFFTGIGYVIYLTMIAYVKQLIIRFAVAALAIGFFTISASAEIEFEVSNGSEYQILFEYTEDSNFATTGSPRNGMVLNPGETMNQRLLFDPGDGTTNIMKLWYRNVTNVPAGAWSRLRTNVYFFSDFDITTDCGKVRIPVQNSRLIGLNGAELFTIDVEKSKWYYFYQGADWMLYIAPLALSLYIVRQIFQNSRSHHD